ncbi:hypothetical protein LZC95_20170 [Pendulispora brunnea]|uniref:Uncharacterized protein n=1 Tax=Pendulispora brunnea TaxID=2905690 RepID=A0ABZ2KPY1_9BACT
MRNLEDLHEALSEFIDQDEATVMVLRSRDEELAPVAHCLRELDAGIPHVLFVDVTPLGSNLLAYVEAVLTSLVKAAEEVQVELQEDGEPPLPPFPDVCFNRMVEPMVRLRTAFGHLATSWLPDDNRHFVVALLPDTIVDRQVHAHVVGWLLPQAGFEPWLARTRFIVRDDKASSFVVDTACRARLPGVVYLDTRLTAADHVESLLQDANNNDLELGQRLNALLQCAMVEVSLGRLPQAMAKFAPLYEHYAAHGIHQMQGLVLLQVAEAFRRANSLGLARNCLLGALDLATKNGDLGMMATSTHALVPIAAAQAAHLEVESASSVGMGAAAALKMHDLHADFFLRLGDARAGFGNWAGAITSWTDGATFARDHAGQAMLLQLLGRLQDYAARAGYPDTARQYAAEIQRIRATGESA